MPIVDGKYINPQFRDYGPPGLSAGNLNDMADTLERLDAKEVVTSVNGETGDVVLDASDIGLGNVDNTSDTTKKENFTGAIASGNTGFAQGGAVYDALARKLNLTGGTLTGAVGMSGNKVTDLATGTNNGDAVNLGQMNEAINSSSANYKGSFASRAALLAVAWQDTDPTAANFVSNNDYAYVADDETHGDEAWRYIYVKSGAATGSWTAAYRINEAPLTEAQMAALNSGITAALVQKIGDNTSDIADVETALTGKQDTLVSGTNIKTVNGASVLGAGNLQIPALPSVSAEDNGKVLTVVSGAWAAAELPVYDGGVTYEP